MIKLKRHYFSRFKVGDVLMCVRVKVVSVMMEVIVMVVGIGYNFLVLGFIFLVKK